MIITINNDKFNDGTSSNCINDEQICRLATTVHCSGGVGNPLGGFIVLLNLKMAFERTTGRSVNM